MRKLFIKSIYWAVLSAMILLSAVESKAGMDAELESFFNSMGYNSNVTGGGAYEDQSGGYYTGGRVYARAPSKTIDLANIQVPSFSAGCGGIDLFLGGMSFISSKELISALRKIATNAVGYSVNLALQTQTPQVYNTIQKMNDIAREINNMNISSCETAASIVGGVWPRSDASSRYLCNAMGNKNSVFNDWAASRQGCGVEGKRDSVNKGNKTGEFEDLLGDEFNLVWKAIRKNTFLSSDKELAEVFMSISGTIIAKKVGDGKEAKPKKPHYPSLANDQDLINALLYGTSESGNQAKIYKCDGGNEDKCLNPTLQALSVAKDKALVNKVDDLLRKIAEKARSYGEPDEKEKGLVNSTKIPIQKIIIVENAFKSGSSIINVTEFSEGIAYDLVLQFMEQVLDVVNQSLTELEEAQIDGKMITEFKQNLRDVRKLIIERRNGIYQQMLTTLSIIQKTKLAESQLHHMFSSYNNLEE